MTTALSTVRYFVTRSIISVGLLFVFALLIGCKVVTSTKVGDGESEEVDREGLAYFLPKVKIHILATLKETLVTNSSKLIPISSTIVDSNNVEIASLITNVVGPNSVTNFFSTNLVSMSVLSTNGQGPSLVQKNIGTNVIANPRKIYDLNATVNVTNSLRTLQTNVVYGSTVNTNYFYDISVSEVFQKDPSHLYLLSAKNSWFAHDTLNISVNSDGFLSSVTSTNADKSGQVFVELAKAAAKVFQLSVTGGFAPMVETEKKLPKKIDVTFDPFDQFSYNKATNALATGGLFLEFNDMNYYSNQTNWAKAPNKTAGLLYRPALPYELLIKSRAMEAEIRQLTVNLPNVAPVLTYEINRASFVTKSTQLTFSNGFPINAVVDKPSQFLSIVETPVKILDSVISLPTNIFQAKFDIQSGANKLAGISTNSVTSQLIEIENTIKLLDAQTRLIQALAATNNAVQTNNAAQ